MIFKTLATSALAISLFLQFNPLDPSDGRCFDDDGNPYNGYAWNDDPSICVPGLIDIETWYTPAPPYSYGDAVWYAPNVMEGTARYRQLSLEGFVDGVSLMSPSDIGRTVWLRRFGRDWEGPFLVVDCARRGDIWPVIMKRGEVVEVGFQTAAKWGFVDAKMRDDGVYDRPYVIQKWKMENVEVLKMDAIPSRLMNHYPIDYVRWWGDRAVFSNGYDIPKPRGLNPDYYPEYHPGWMWQGEDESFPMGPYDDWFSLLFGDDDRYEFDLPNNHKIAPRTLSHKWLCIIDFRCSPGID